MQRSPWWFASVLGVACALLGAVLTLRPFTSLRVLLTVVAVGALVMGVSSLAASHHASRRWPDAAAGLLWLAVGVVVLGWPDMTTRALAVVVGIALVAGGALDVVAGLRGSTDERPASVIGGGASVVFGVLAMSWPSVTVLVVAVVFGARLVIAGVRGAWSAFRERDGGPAPGATASRVPHRGARSRIGHVAVASLGLVVALGLAALSAALHAGVPVLDEFYDTPDEVSDAPGRLLDAEPFDRTIPEDAEAWRILYTTTRAEGQPAVASALVVVPAEPGEYPLPVIALAHGTTGVDRRCAPSVLAEPFEAGAFHALDRVVDEGWALVATDYVGLGTEGGHPYLVGEPEGRSVLDAVRAARALTDTLPEVDLAEETVVWGHSQGGRAALWAGQLAPQVAPDAGVVGVAALAPASDLVAMAADLGSVTGGSIFASYILQGYAHAFPDVEVRDYVRPAARASFDAVVRRCLSEPSILLSAIGSVTVGDQVFSKDLASGPLLARLQQQVPTRPIAAPLLIAQGEADTLVDPDVQADYVAARCAVGQPIDVRTYPGLGHLDLVEADSPLLPELFAWTRARFAGVPPTPTCGG